MSQVEPKLYALLTADPTVSAIVGARVYPMVMPQRATFPAVTYFRVSGGQQNTLDGYSGTENPRIQVDCWAKKYADVKALAAAIRAAMDGATTFRALCISDRDLYEDDADLFRVLLEFSCWNKE